MKNAKSQSGQALIEYILVLIVVVGLILGAMYQLNSAFKVWANAYFGEYLTCMMEAGELPGLGAPPTESECGELYQEFSLAQGEPLVGEGVSENDGTGSAGSGGGGSATAAPSGNSESDFVASSRAGGNNRGSASRFRSRNSGAGGDGEDEGDGIDRQDSSGGGATVEGFSNEEGRPQRFALREATANGRGARAKKEEEDKKKPTKAKNVEQGPEQKSGPKLIKISRAPNQTVDAPEIEELGIGGFLRYLIITAIIIALVIFIGGQVLQVSKSME